MSQSLLLKIARESITEVFEAQNIINTEELLKDYPVLNEPLAAFVSIYIDKELRGESGCAQPNTSLLKAIIHHAKAAAFQDKEPLKVSQYLQAEIQLSLLTPLEKIHYTNINDLQRQIRINIDGVYLISGEKTSTLLPSYWSGLSHVSDFLQELFKQANIKESELLSEIEIYTFQVEKSRDEPILN